MANKILIKGARVHNLKSIDLELPRDSLIVFTGLSGSGKSSLAFDTIFAEGQRRYVESLSTYARQFLGRLDKPDVDLIEGLSPAVSIDQKSTNRNPRSTVGTITEIYDFLRLLYARVGIPHCPACGCEITKQSPQQIVEQLLNLPEKTRFIVLAPLVQGRKGEHLEVFSNLQKQGYSRVLVDGVVYRITEVPKLRKQEKHSIAAVVDRLVVSQGAKQRFTDSIETALKLADGKVHLELVDLAENDSKRIRRFSEYLACPNEHEISLDTLEPVNFSFNSPYGACVTCDGLGFHQEVDLELVIPDPSLSIKEGALAPYNSPYYQNLFKALAKQVGFSLDTAWNKLSKKIKDIILYGLAEKLPVRFNNTSGVKTYNLNYEGVITTLERKISESFQEGSKSKFTNYLRQSPCKSCNGARLKPEILSVTLTTLAEEQLNIANFCHLALDEALTRVESLKFSQQNKEIADPIVKEIRVRLQFLIDVGLHYLSLDRYAASLSGGEAQRIRLATQIGTGLVGVLYVLDEPSIGLHQRDNLKLIATLKRLKDIGNTLIVVEHDEDTISTADWIVDIGPAAGEYGGQVVHNGTYKKLLANDKSLTAAYLSGRLSVGEKRIRRKINPNHTLTVIGARENNLKNLKVDFPLGCLTVVTGVSGSGKSSLVNDILANALAVKLNHADKIPGLHTRIIGLTQLDKLVQVDQSPIGKTPRSNPATYTGVFDKIRNLFAQTPEAKIRGYSPGRFSFNVKGGRCENCEGDGTIKIEMNFLPDVYVACEVCHGSRYNDETLAIKYKDKNIAEVLELSIIEANEFFTAIPSIKKYLQTLVEVGLGYIRLGQSATTLSGGEAQRVKLAAELQKRSTGKIIYILDEPTTGLHFDDINKLLQVINGLVDKGNSVIIIEHNLDVIKTADWIIDLGPEGGSGGGELVVAGTPEQVATHASSYTGKFLQPLLNLNS